MRGDSIVVLELRGVHKAYGAVPVIRALNLQVAEGELVGVIGPNGAGKTTAFGLIAGHLRCDSGSVLLAGRDVTALKADERCRGVIGLAEVLGARLDTGLGPFTGHLVFLAALLIRPQGLLGRRAH